ncbi:MAG: hypothetical protein H0V45_10850 [Actinobacteria bacterium]|nr:hypothetical protein [Actinomycetota bacterium]
MRFRGLLALAAAAACLVPGDGLAQNPRLEATVGPGFTISLKLPGGADVRQLDPGTYEIVVRDLSDFHNFHLTGPGVNQSTTVEFEGTVTWTVTFREGRYQFECNPHSYDLNGNFIVGNPPPVTTTPKPPPSPTPTAKKLVATVGPGNTITLRNATGGLVRGLKAGAYAITVRDRTRQHNFHLTGAGVNRKTGIAQVATATWKVTLKAGTLRFFSDAAATKLRGSVKVS